MTKKKWNKNNMSIFNISTINLFYIIPLFGLGAFFVYRIFLKNKNFNSSPLALMRNYKYSKSLFTFRVLFLSISVILLFASILRPAWGNKTRTVESEGADVVFTLDVSQSMKALDVGGGSADRLSLAKSMIGNFASLHPENRYGLVIFAGEAFVSTPLTIDMSAFLTFLEGVGYNDVGTQGTDINAALMASIDRFYSEQDKKRGRAVVIISDGGEEMTGDIDAFAKVIRELNIKIFTIGIGGVKGVPIPDGTDIFGRTTYKEYRGETVITKLNEKILKNIADKTGGEYFHAGNEGDLDKITDKLKKLETTSIKIEEKAGREDKYQYFLLPAFLFFIFFIFSEFAHEYIPLIKRKIAARKVYFKIFIIAIFTFSITGCSNSSLAFRYYNTQGNKKFVNEYLEEARDEYFKAGESSRDLKYIADNNYALTYYKLEDYEKAAKKLEEAIFIYCEDQKSKHCDKLYYNLGNAYYRIGEKKEDEEQSGLWQKAIESYKKDLEINPEDKAAEENIAFIMDKLGNNEESESQGQGDSEENGEPSGKEQGQGENSEKNGGSDGEKQDQGENSEESGGDSAGENSESQDENDAEGDSAKGAEPGDSENKNAGQPDQASPTGLDEKTNQQIENYMKNLEEQAKNNQDYFQPNPNGSYDNYDPFRNFFGSSLFDDFFNNNSSQSGFNNKESNEVDW